MGGKIDDVDIVKKFARYQKSLGNSALSYKSHLQNILATSGILFLTSHQHPHLLNFVENDTCILAREKILEEINLNDEKRFSRAKLLELLDIVKKANSKKITAVEVSKLLLDLLDDEVENHEENRVILCFKSLLEHLPDDFLEVKEMELTTRFVQPFLQPLFEDKSESRFARFTDAQTEEYKRNPDHCYNKRPDGCITVIAQENYNIGFIEIKEEAQKYNAAKINKDVYKLGVFSKNAIIQNGLHGALSVQIVGSSATFYYTKKKSNNFFIMIEVDQINIPRNLKELPQLLGFVDNLCNLLHILKTSCCKR